MNSTRCLAAAVVAAFLCLSFESRAEVVGTFGPVTIEASHVPSAGLAGFSTWTIAATSATPLRRFDFATDDVIGAYGFFGPLNQLHPAGNKTTLSGDWAFVDFCFCDPAHDSNLGVIGSAMTLIYPRSTEVDSTTELSAAFDLTTPQSGTMTFARLVIPDAAAGIVTFRGQIGFAPAASQDPVTVFGQIGVPEPASAGLIPTALLLLSLARNRRRVA